MSAAGPGPRTPPAPVCVGPPPRLLLSWDLGVGRDGWFQGSLRGHASQSQARPRKPGCLTGLSQSPAQSGFCLFLFWFCFAFFLFGFVFKENKTFQNKVDKNLFF